MANPILVTGSPRSGTTWIGKMINLSDHIGYIHEAYNVMIHKNLPSDPDSNKFCLVSDENESKLEMLYTKILSFEYGFWDQLHKNLSIPNFFNSVVTGWRMRKYRKQGKRALIKDPYAIFAAEWMNQRFSMVPLILIRHPAPIFDSYQRLGWEIDFNRLINDLSNSNLVQLILDSDVISDSNPPLTKQIAVLWNLIHKQIEIYETNHPEWLYLRYEDIFLNIESNFRVIFDYLNIPLRDDILAHIYHYTSTGYFAQEKSRNEARIERHDLLNGWKRRVSSFEIDEIREHIDLSLYGRYYSEDNWDTDIKY